MSKQLSLSCVLCLLAFTGAAGAAIFNVNDTSDLVDNNTADSQCQTAAVTCTLRAAIQQANALTGPGTDTVNIPAGIYVLTIAGVGEDAALTGDLDITDHLDIAGAGPGKTIIDAKGIDRVFDVQGSINVSISELAIRGGAALDSVAPGYLGGGILVSSASLDLAKCALSANRANQGGGLFANTLSTTTVFDCSFRDNRALDLGFTNTLGSAILSQGTMDLDRVEVSGNESDLKSGVVFGLNATSLSIRNSTISGNQDVGLSVQNTELDLVNSSVYSNTSGGLSVFSNDGTHPLTVRNSILADNGASDCFPFASPAVTDFFGEHNLDSDGSCPLDLGAVDLPATDPMLGPLQLNGGTTRTHVPMVGSPVIDVGNNARCETPDQRGAPRPLDGGPPSAIVCDIGAVEVLPCDPPFTPDEVLPFFETASINLFEACYTITNGSDFSVLLGGDVTWMARDLITLQNGFSVFSGGIFEAILDPAAGSFTALP